MESVYWMELVSTAKAFQEMPIPQAALTFLAALSLHGTQAATPARRVPPARGDAEYFELLRAAREHPEAANWTNLRVAYTRTSGYDPRSDATVDFTPMFQELQNGERAAAGVLLDRLMEGHWLDIRAQHKAAFVCTRLDQSRRADLHLAFAIGLLDSILDSGDGHSFETAYQVVDRNEQVAVLEWLGLTHGQATTRIHNQSTYEIHAFSDSQVDRETKVYFRILSPQPKGAQP